jgi:predicted ATP-grasp superfamily ATP-dependent carboligase
MLPAQLEILARPRMGHPRMILGLSGWMDGGDVSTGTVEYLAAKLNAPVLGLIRPADFYLCSFPAPMEVSALLRPYCKIREGLVVEFRGPSNRFYFAEDQQLILFQGKEPNLRWEDYADCLFAVAGEFHVRDIFFIGSVAGVVPHTRDPRLFFSASDAALRAELSHYDMHLSNYEGPAGISTFLTHAACEKGLRMATIVAEIPAYIQGRNPRCIESVARHLAGMLNLQVPLDDLRALSDAFEQRVSEVIDKREDLAPLIRKLESDYDSEVFDTQMGDLKVWLQQQGVRLD